MSDVIEYGVLGGGLCGLLVANELRRRRKSFLVLESEREPGGLARTVRFDDIPGDTGPHALYSRNKKVRDFFLRLPLRYDVHERKVRVVHHGENGEICEVDYPFENGLGDLPVEHRVDCIIGYVEAFNKGRGPFRNLRDWIDNGLGDGIARHFMIPYNRKIWNAGLSKISMGLVKKKIEPAPVRTVVKSALGVRTVGRKVQAVFIYPRGGIGSVTKVLAKRAGKRLITEAKVTRIRQINGQHEVRTTKGVHRFRRLISTIPLKDFLVVQSHKGLRRYRRKLHNNNTLFVAVALKKGRKFSRFDDCHWLFFAGPEIFYRVNMMHVFHRSRSHYLVAEITWRGAVTRFSHKQVEIRVVRDLIKTGILRRRSDVRSIHSKYVPYTYPIPTVGLEKIIADLDRVFLRKRIHLLGRNGHWDYINMDMVVERVWEFFERFLKR